MTAEKTLTKEEWGRLEKALSGIYGIAKLKVDGHEVSFERRLIDKNRLGIVVYIDGVLKGEWLGKEKADCPEQRYLYPRSCFVYTAKRRAEQKKLL